MSMSGFVGALEQENADKPGNSVIYKVGLCATGYKWYVKSWNLK